MEYSRSSTNGMSTKSKRSNCRQSFLADGQGRGVTIGRKIDSLRPNGWRSRWLVLIKIVLHHRVGEPIQYRHQTWPCDGIENNCIESTDNWMGGRA